MNLPDFLTQDEFGEIRLKGHRIGLYSVVRRFKEGYSAERIAEEYPSLPSALVKQVLGFYEENVTEVDAYVDACRKEIDREVAAPPGPGVLKVRQLMHRARELEQR
jgi:uncharacterized protein (DUF433 family)